MNTRAFYVFFILVFLNTTLLSKDLTIEEFNEIKRGLKSDEITIEQFNDIIDEFEISSDIFKISKDLFLNNAIEIEDYLKIIENSLLSEDSLNSIISENETNSSEENSSFGLNGKFIFQTKVTKLTQYVTDLKYGELFDHTLLFENNSLKDIKISQNNVEVLRFTKPKLTILNNGKFNIKSNVIDPEEPASPLRYRFDGLIDKNSISGSIQIIYNGNQLPAGTILLELETVEQKASNNNSDNNIPNLKNNELFLKLKIIEVDNSVPPSLNAKVNNIENLIFVMDGDQVKEILYQEKSNKFFSKKIVRSFKNIKIKLTNEKYLKGKSKLILNEFRSENVVIWWNLNISQNNLSGEVELELVGRGPQIRLIPVND